MKKWKNKIAVVTGASSGIGFQIVKDLAMNGIIVIAMSRNVDKIEKSFSNLGEMEGKIFCHNCDVSDYQSLKDSFDWIEKKFTQIHILINNAGVLYKGSILDNSEDFTKKIDNVINVNFRGAVHCARKALHLMNKSRDFGIVININSIAGQNVYSGLHISNIYSPTKFGLTAFSEILRQQLVIDKNNKIRISNLSPGVVKTEIMVRGKVLNSIEDYDNIPHMCAEDISQGVLYVLSTPYHVNVTQLTIKPVGEKK